MTKREWIVEPTNLEDSLSDRERLQTVIDQCAEAGGGRVIIPSGSRFVIGGIRLRSNVELHLQRDSLLQGNGCEETYIERPGPFERLQNETPISGLIYAKDAVNISITGEGRIDGNYRKFIPEGQETARHIAFFKYPRPMMVYFENCSSLALEDITLTDAPFWTVHLVGCRGGLIYNVKIRNEMRMPNTDGFDIDRCKDIQITDCDILTGDDAICPKCTEETAVYGDCENVTVTNCRLQSASSAIKFGSSSFGTFRDFVFENIDIVESNRGLAFQLRDTGAAEDILFRNIRISTKRFSKEWWGTGEPIYVTVCRREDGMEQGGHISNILFDNIDCACENGILLFSDEEDSIVDIKFRNVTMDFWKRTEYESEGFDLRPCRGEQFYPGKLTALTAVRVNGLDIRGLKVIDHEEMLQEQHKLVECKNLQRIQKNGWEE